MSQGHDLSTSAEGEGDRHQADNFDELRRRVETFERQLHDEEVRDRLQTRRRTRRLALITAFSLTFAVGGYALTGWSTCSKVLPAPMTTFCAGQPALASQVNGNFATLIKWLETNKVGTLSKAGLQVPGSVSASSAAMTTAVVAGKTTTKTLQVTSSVSTPMLTADSLATDKLTLSGASPQVVSGAKDGNLRLSASNWIIAQFGKSGAANFVSNGKTVAMISSAGELSSKFGSKNGGLETLLPASFCVVVPVTSQTCPFGWTLKAVVWDTEDDDNGDSGKDGKIATNYGTNGVKMTFCCRGKGW